MTGWSGHTHMPDCDPCGAERCEVCGVWTQSPHEPHDRDCPRTGDCDCDNQTCSSCCWECEGTAP